MDNLNSAGMTIHYTPSSTRLANSFLLPLHQQNYRYHTVASASPTCDRDRETSSGDMDDGNQPDDNLSSSSSQVFLRRRRMLLERKKIICWHAHNISKGTPATFGVDS